jgi:Dyp-type peroxidase family
MAIDPVDLFDIQGNILRGYRSFHCARFLFFHLSSDRAGREFVGNLLRCVTPGTWPKRPSMATNVAFTFRGLAALRLQAESLASFPPEFQEGMQSRALLLGDTGDCAPENWDRPWGTRELHVLVTCYAEDPKTLDDQCKKLAEKVPEGVKELPSCQDAAALVVDGTSTRIEHFGFVDGISNPDVEGVPDNGGHGDTGNPDENGKFLKIPIGEFILGHRSEGGEVPPMPAPRLLARNGSFLVVRKLEQDVVAFRKFLREKSVSLKQVLGDTTLTDEDAQALLAAKMLGRWCDGSPLALYPTKAARDPSNNFGYADDLDGARCPLGAHIRRANPRASLGFGGNLVRRRRLIRRGIPYGRVLPDADGMDTGADERRGLMFLAFCSSIDHQFEFLQRQWLNYGDEFRQGNDTDPIVGARYGDGRTVGPGEASIRGSDGTGRMVIPGDERTGRPPFLCCDIPRFVTTKGGDYFFAPSLTALRLLATGEVVVS